MSEQLSVSEMLRTTINNATDFLIQIANHIDSLEAENAELRAKIAEFEKEIGDVQE